MRIGKTYNIVNGSTHTPLRPSALEVVRNVFINNKRAMPNTEIESITGYSNRFSREQIIILRRNGELGETNCRCSQTPKFYYKKHEKLIPKLRKFKIVKEPTRGQNALIVFNTLKAHPNGLTKRETAMLSGIKFRRVNEKIGELKTRGYIKEGDCGCSHKVPVLYLKKSAKPLVDRRQFDLRKK